MAHLGHPWVRIGAPKLGCLVALAAAVACGHGESSASQDAGLSGEAAPCVPGPDGSIGGPPPDNCPNDLPPDTDCPGASPSYQNDIAPIVRDRCTICHNPNGLETTKLFGTFDQVHQQRVQMLNFIYGCRMPPTCAAQPTPDERRALLKWFVCGAMNN